MTVFIIAEAGVNHGGNEFNAHELIDAAETAGADACKFQAFTPERLDPPGERRDMLKGLKLSEENFRNLARRCEDVGIEFMATPFDADWLKFLVDECGMKRIKIGSGNLDNKPLLTAAGATDCEIILSTGMATANNIAEGISHIGRQAALLQCTSAYPSDPNEVNLSAMGHLMKFGVGPVGLSLHAPEPAIGIAAVALGAELIETHFCLPFPNDGPDLSSSMLPPQFRQMVDGIRLVERALGDGIKRPMPSEAKAIEIAQERKSWRESQATAAS